MEKKHYTEEQILEALSEVEVGAGDTSEVLSYLGRLPSAEPIIRCKDCTYYCDNGKCDYFSVDERNVEIHMDSDGFCSEAERRQDE